MIKLIGWKGEYMEELKLKATKRDVLGKRNRFLRKQGITPAHLFGHNIESMALQCETADLKKVIDHAGTSRLVTLTVAGDKSAKNVFVREIQRDAFTKQLIHVDLYQVQKGEKISMNVPIVLVGEAPALKGKGRLLTHGIEELHIECLPENVPPQIEVDISVLAEVDDMIHVKDLHLGKDITVLADPDQLLARVSEVSMKAAAEAEAEEEGAAAEAEAAPAAEEAASE